MNIHFEEKTYENYFNSELNNRSTVYFPIGQVQEGRLGFDSSAQSNNRYLWRRLGFPHWFYPRFMGVNFSKIAEMMSQELSEELKSLPNFKTNLLFQYKRPAYITTDAGNEWPTWERKYYRYHIERHQQELLMKIHNSLGNDVLIIYAAPALPDVGRLVKAHLAGTIIENSNFKRVSELATHSLNTYIESGTYSVAFSEPEKIENFDLLKEISNERRTPISKESNENADTLKKFSQKIGTILQEDSNLSGPYQALAETVKEFAEYPLLHSLLLMQITRDLTGFQWIIKL